MKYPWFPSIVLLVLALAGCSGRAETPTVMPTAASADIMPIGTPSIRVLPSYAFPDLIDTGKSYMFYLHGKIIEDEGLPAISPEYGEYEYEAILEKLTSQGFRVVSEQRTKNTDPAYYAARVSEQIALLTQAGVPPEQITVVGASKGAWIAVLISNLVKDTRVNYVLLGFCAADTIQQLEQQEVVLHGNVLAIHDSADQLSGSCQQLFDDSEDRGLDRRAEIVLNVGTGHGILYHPLDAWILPTVQWAQGQWEQALTAEQQATLVSLEKVDDHPLYVMHYSGAYNLQANSLIPARLVDFSLPAPGDACLNNRGCSLFAALGDEASRIYGRNFDWRFSPALLLFTDPPDGYASVSMVDIEYLGFEGEDSRHLIELSLEKRRALLDAPYLPFDGMNEKGLAVGMASVPPGNMPIDPQKEMIDELRAIREILDHAATVQEATDILGSYNIDMGNVPIHYLVASQEGEAVLVEFYQGEMRVFRNDDPWLVATNFLMASVAGDPHGQCWRYDLISKQMKEGEGSIDIDGAVDLLARSSQDNTQWSVIYQMSSGDVQVIMDRKYSTSPHRFELNEVD